jgi:hypothetical protein
VIAGCEDNGIVGSTFLPSNPALIVDTVSTLNLETVPLVSYAGNKSVVALGRYEDALFGTYESIAMLTPGLLNSADTLLSEYRYGFVLRPVAAYGDTMSTTTFDVYEIKQRWRAQEWKMDDQPVLGSQPITRFELGNTDSLFVEMPQEWVNRYLSYYAMDSEIRDSAYVASEFGVAFVPVSGNKISYLSSIDNAFIVQRPDTTSVSTTIRQRASNYRLIQSGRSLENAVVINNDFTQTGRFSFYIDENTIGSKVVSRAELVFYEDTELLNATLPVGHTRYSDGIVRIFDLADDEKEFYVTKNPVTSAVIDSMEGSYRFNITNLVNGSIAEGGREFTYYVVTDTDNGIIRPGLILNSGAGLKAPRIIVTRVEANQ